MKKFIFIFILTVFTTSLFAQEKAYQAGEWFKFRVHYGWFNASFATLEVKDVSVGDKEFYHVEGKGESTGLLDLFFKVDDNYQTYIDKETLLPFRFIRNIDEGGYTKHREIYFDQDNHRAKVKDIKKDTEEYFDTKNNVQDMLSLFYFLRNKIDHENLKKGDEIMVDIFYDNENHRFKTVFLGHDTIKTKFGKIDALKFRPYVMAGRVFEEEESLTFWVSNDKNKIPLKIQAELAVGSLEADLDAFKGLKHPFKINFE